MLVERFNRTLRQLSAKILKGGHIKQPHAALLAAVEAYNETPSAITHIAPRMSFSDSAIAKIIDHYMERDIKQEMSSVKPKFKLGQVVRLKDTARDKFTKSSTPLWLADKYKIDSIIRTTPLPSYKLTSHDGGIHLPATVSQALLQ